MTQNAEVVIIGGGVMGTATAYHLALKGCADVVLLERRSLAAEGTGHSGAIVRQHYSQESIVRVAARSVEIFEQFEERTGVRDVFHQTGWIKIGDPGTRGAMERNIKRNRDLGVESYMLSEPDLVELVPGIVADDIEAALFEPRSGWADPVATTQGLANAAAARGVKILEGTAATGLIVDGSRVIGVETSQGTIGCNSVVVAAGPWGKTIAGWAGIDVPIEVTREQDLHFECDDETYLPKLPVSNNHDFFYWRPETGNRVLVGDGYPKEMDHVNPNDFNRQHDSSFESKIMGLLSMRLPEFAKRARIVSGYASLYDVTPDWHPILGRVPEVAGLLLCIGHSGHGFKLGPAFGELMAEEVLDGRAHSIDIEAMRFNRFADGKLVEGAYMGNQA